MQVYVTPEATIMKNFVNDVWQSPTRKIVFNGEVIDIDEWAEENGVTLPDSGD